MVFLEVSLMNFFFRYGQMEDESGVSRSIIDQLHSSDIQGDEMEGENCVTRRIIDELHSWGI